MKIIIDTNVFISGIFFSDPPHQILKAWRDKKIQIVISPEILAEYQRVGESLTAKYPEIDIHPFLELLTAKSELISTKSFPVYVCEDPDDDKFDGFVKSHQICFRWLSKNFDIQGVVIFQVRDDTYGMSSV